MEDDNDETIMDTKLAKWLEETIGGTITSMDRQLRHRPAWYIEMDTPEGPRSLFARGARTIGGSKIDVTSLRLFEQDWRALPVLAENGIRIPRIHGMCPDPQAIVMDRATGRENLATAVSEEERESVMDQMIEQMVKIHSIDPAKFVAAGMVYPTNATERALLLFDMNADEYRRNKKKPDAMIEYLIRWMHRNAPQNRTKVSFVCGDPAQFMFENGKLTAMIDFELSYLGDPVYDLAGMQLRNNTEPLGNLGRALRRYAELTGEPIDPDVFDYHTIAFAASSPLGVAESLSQPMQGGFVIGYLQWYVHYARMAFEIMAHRTGITLPTFTPPEPQASRVDTLAETLVGAVNAIPVGTSFGTYERKSTAILAGYMARALKYEPEFQRADTEDTEALLGKSFDNWQDADKALEDFVMTAEADQDVHLIPLFYARIQRQAHLLEPFLDPVSVGFPTKTYAELLATEVKA